MNITINLVSHGHHCSQVLTGFLMLEKQGLVNLTIEDHTKDDNYRHCSVVEVLAGNKRIIYDTMDGYLALDSMRFYLERVDFYFKRSYNAERNRELFPELYEKIHPLGMYYRIAFPGNPYCEGIPERLAKYALRKDPFSYFTPERFEARIERNENPKVIFSTQLWNPEGNTDKNVQKMNEDRIRTVRVLKETYKAAFFGGL